MNAQQKLKQYAQLVRLPNVFTSITNVLVGYFSAVNVSHSVASEIGLLCASSALLYSSGIVFNDYFDLKVDLVERPSRPLPSGKISKKNALALGLGTMVSANVLALLVSPASFALSLALSGIILAYDKKAKWTVLGPLTMGMARFFNVLLGASAAFNTALIQPGETWGGDYFQTLFSAAVILSYVYSITLLSRREAGAATEGWNSFSTRKAIRIPFFIIGLDVAAMAAFFAVTEKLLALLIVGVMVFVVWKAWQASKVRPLGELSENKGIQQAIKTLVLSIIILDSAFIAAYAGILYGLAAMLLLPVPIVLSRKLYVT